MTNSEIKELFTRILSWPPEDQEKVARVVREIEELRGSANDITDEEWRIIEERAARPDLATDEEADQVFSRYRVA